MLNCTDHSPSHYFHLQDDLKRHCYVGQTLVLRSRTHRIFEKDTDNMEITFGVVGMVSSFKLPPRNLCDSHRKGNSIVLTPKFYRLPTSNPRHLYSDVQIIGGGSASFEKCYNGLLVIRNYLEKRLKTSILPVEEDAFNSFSALTFSNRLLTSRRDLGYDTERSIPEHIDPFHLLPHIAGDEYVYARENHVRYSIQSTSPPS